MITIRDENINPVLLMDRKKLNKWKREENCPKSHSCYKSQLFLNHCNFILIQILEKQHQLQQSDTCASVEYTEDQTAEEQGKETEVTVQEFDNDLGLWTKKLEENMCDYWVEMGNLGIPSL